MRALGNSSKKNVSRCCACSSVRARQLTVRSGSTTVRWWRSTRNRSLNSTERNVNPQNPQKTNLPLIWILKVHLKKKMEDKSVRFIRSLAAPNGAHAGNAMKQNIALNSKLGSAGPKCAVCGDTGWKTVLLGAEERVTRCNCVVQDRAARLLTLAHIPPRYENCDLEGYVAEGSRGIAAAKI